VFSVKAILTIVSVSAVLAVPSAQASNFLLEFPATIWGGQCGSGSIVDQSYGDSSNIDVQYRTRDGFGDTAETSTAVRWWQEDYSDLVGVVYQNGNGLVGEIALIPVQGETVTLNSFDLGAWPNINKSTTVRIFDGDWNEIFTTGSIVVLGATRTSLMPSLTQEGPIYLQWGTDFDVGVDNLSFTLGGAVVPVPAAGLLMVSALAGFSALRRSRTRTAV